MGDLLGSILYGICKWVFAAIPALYSAFNFFAKRDFFSSADIKDIWNHLYVLLSVLVLFAIAIKLINAIVNPDVLTDNKKGVKKAYFSAVVAVFLTVLTPYLFSVLNDIEENIIDNNVIEKQLFGYDSGVDGGNTLAWTTITSFIDLNQLSEVTDYQMPDGGVESSDGHTYVFSEDVSEGLQAIEDARPWKYEDTVYQHPFLMALSGFLIAYELVLLVMDTALRSIKLGLLQMMVPIILGAYIFKSDILKNWFKEYIKTYIQIFLLLVAVNLLTQILRILPSILQGNEFSSNPLVSGIINMLCIFAALRLVKQINPIINSIFGTHLQGKGGIKGRLGDMAAVGGLAQQAWGSFTTGAKNVGKTATKGIAKGAVKGAGYAAGALPYGLATGISRFATGKGKGLERLKSGTAFKDLSGVRKARNFGSAIGAATKTAVGTGDLGKIKDSFTKEFASPEEKARRLNSINDRLTKILTNKESGNTVTSETDIENKTAANNKLATGIRRIAGNKVFSANENYQRAFKKASIAKSIDSDNKAINTLMSSTMGRFAAGSDEQKLLADNLARYESNGNTSELRSFIDSHKNLFDDATLEGLIGKNGKLISKDRKIDFLLDEENGLNLTQSEKDNIQRGTAAVSFLASTLDANATSSKSNLDIAVAGEKLNDLEKMEVDKYISSMQDVNSSLAFAIGRTDTENKLDRSNSARLKDIQFYESNDGSTSNSTSSQNNSSQSGSSSSDSSGGSTDTSTPPERLQTSSDNRDDFFAAQYDARVEYLRNKTNLTDSEKNELKILTEGKSKSSEEYKERQRKQAAQDWADNEGTLDE